MPFIDNGQIEAPDSFLDCFMHRDRDILLYIVLNQRVVIFIVLLFISQLHMLLLQVQLLIVKLVNFVQLKSALFQLVTDLLGGVTQDLE